MCSNSLTLRIPTTIIKADCFASRRSPTVLRLPDRRLAPPPRLNSVGASSSEPLESATYTSTVGSPPTLPRISQWSFTDRHVLVLNVIACSVAVSATWLFCSAIPTLLAFKRAAESMEKLLDVTREELPGTMAAVRLSGMEISDLTMELSDFGQQITQGVRGSTRAVRLAEERLRQFTNTAPSASMQEVVTLGTKTPEPTLAKIARSMKVKVVQGRALWKMFFTLTRFSRTAHKYFASRGTS